MSEQRHTFTVDTKVAVHGCSDDTFGVVRLRLAAEAKIRQLLKGLNRNVRGIDKTEGGDV